MPSKPLKEKVLQDHPGEMEGLKARTFLGFLPQDSCLLGTLRKTSHSQLPGNLSHFSLEVISLVQGKWLSLILKTTCQEKEEIPEQSIWQKKQEADGSQSCEAILDLKWFLLLYKWILQEKTKPFYF